MVLPLVPLLIGLAGMAASAAAQSMRENANKKIAAAQEKVEGARKDYEIRRAEAQRKHAELLVFKGHVTYCVVPSVLEVAEMIVPVQAEAVEDASEPLRPFDQASLTQMNEVVAAISSTPRFQSQNQLAMRGHQTLARGLTSNSGNPQMATMAGGAMAALGVVDLAVAFWGTGRADEAHAAAEIATEEILAQLPILIAIEKRVDELMMATEVISHEAFRHTFMLRRIIGGQSSFTYHALTRHDRERVLMFIEFAKALWNILGERVIDEVGEPTSNALPQIRRLTTRSI